MIKGGLARLHFQGPWNIAKQARKIKNTITNSEIIRAHSDIIIEVLRTPISKVLLYRIVLDCLKMIKA